MRRIPSIRTKRGVIEVQVGTVRPHTWGGSRGVKVGLRFSFVWGHAVHHEWRKWLLHHLLRITLYLTQLPYARTLRHICIDAPD